MSPAAALNPSFSPDTPLVNLFAYIRDLFTTAQAAYRFDDRDQVYWSLDQLNLLSESAMIDCQWDDPTRPILIIQRGDSVPLPDLPADLQEWVILEQLPGKLPDVSPISKRLCAFEDSADRIQAYRSFYDSVHDKPLEEVQHIQVPAILDKWVKLEVENDRVFLSQIEQAEEAFGESELRQELLIAYRRAIQNSQEGSAHQVQINAIYDRLHDLFYSLKAKAEHQMCLSFGLVSGKIGGTTYRNFLFHIPLKLTLSKQSLILEADTLAHVITCEQFFTELLDAHFSKESEETIRERKLKVLQEVDQFNSQSRRFNFEASYLKGSFYEAALKILDVFPKVKDQFFRRGKLDFALVEPSKRGDISLSFSPVIHARELSTGVQVARDADKIIAKINELGTLGKNELIPDYFKQLFSLRSAGNPLRIAYRSENKAISHGQSTEMQFPERFLFPLPYNQEQLSIVEQLLKQDAVTVQGPPGTGKSHTIANLASHFVAEGKSILIVSKNAKVLEVIKKKLPIEIRALAVALLEGNKNQEELKHAIDALKHNLSRTYEPATIERLETEMNELERESAETQAQIIQQIQANHEQLALYDPAIGQSKSRSAAEWIQRWATIDPEAMLLSDTIHHSTDTSDWARELEQLIQGQTRKEDQTESLIHIEEMKRQGIEAEQLDEALFEELNAIADIQGRISKLQSYCQHPQFDQEELAEIWAEYVPLCERIESRQRDLLRFQVSLGELDATNSELLLEELEKLLGKFNQDGKLGFLKKKMLPQIQKQLLACQLNQRAVKGTEDLGWIQIQLQQEVDLKQLRIVLENSLSKFGVRSAEADPVQLYRQWDRMIQGLRTLASSKKRVAKLHLQWKNSPKEWRTYTDELKSYRRQQTWSASRESLQKELLQRYASVLPTLVSHVKTGQQVYLTEAQLEMAIFAQKLHSFLTETIQTLGDPNEGLSRMQAIQQQINRLTCQLVAEKTWQRKQASVTDQQRSSLTAWRNDLINIGKGYGKNTERNMTSAVANMQLAKDIVPIWIMQQETALSYFADPEPGQFDLLIVDEASQCDISMLNLIFRCKKCIIVGDENQTSVATQSRLFPISRTNQLLDRYLVNHPFRQQFNINNRSASIYTLSGVIYPNIISLREHFRCRPELIGFSNQYIYDNHIIPLRTAEHNLYGEATEVHYIEDSPEDKRKPAIVSAACDLITGLIEDVEAGHLPVIPSLGILCLDSSNEAHRELIIRELSRHPKIKAHAEALDLLVGTSREFQGDERDIMILTTTASHSFDKKGKLKAPRAVLGEEMARIYNVAASRARDKAILLHSIHPEALLKMNPDCYRKRMIDYFSASSQKKPSKKMCLPMHPAKGEIGQELYAWLSTQLESDDLYPQFKIGPYAIDLAIIRGGKKQALFIDGVQEKEQMDTSLSLQQQLTLERAGWNCLRVQALAWNWDRDAMQGHLTDWLS